MPFRATIGLLTASALLTAGWAWAARQDPKPEGDDARPKVEVEGIDEAEAGADDATDGATPGVEGKVSDKAKAKSQAKAKAEPEPIPEAEDGGRIEHTEAEWRRLLTPAQFYVVRMKGTEPAWSGKYAQGSHHGTFACVGCGAELFSSDHKFQSGTGWPSFYRPIVAARLTTAPDFSDGEPRVEVECTRCGAHLGHVFNDGPPPTGLRFCINSVSLKLKPATKARATAKAKASAKTKASAKVKASAKAKVKEGEAGADAKGAEGP